MWTNAVFSGRRLHISFIIDAELKHVELATVARLPVQPRRRDFHG
jgi:hypothetical protein